MFNLLLAGSTTHTLQLADALATDARFAITGVLTPAAKLIGRAQTLTENPVALWAKTRNLPIISISEKIDVNVKKAINEHKDSFGCDFLLVVDFGYFIPDWLLAVPTIGPVNVHPSNLPAWRGSSPGQRVLLAGETKSAISVIMVSNKLDQGDIVAQLPFSVDPTWDSGAYYENAFNLLAPQLGEILTKLASGEITPQPQPEDSPTPVAGKLTKADSYVPWDWVIAAVGWQPATAISVPPEQPPGLLQELGAEIVKNPSQLAALLFQASKAFSPWPKLWTIAPTTRGWQRLILHQTTITPDGKLAISTGQLEGKTPMTGSELAQSLNART
jgi:methionyl-tRNA formyltransferase